jgi:hypothetical protein
MMHLGREDGRRRIEQEDHLINHRFSWLVGSQAFLLTAFVLLRNDPRFYEVPEKMTDAYKMYVHQTDLLVYLVAVAGLIFAVCSTIGVYAAHGAIQAWRKKVNPEEQVHLTADFFHILFGGVASFLPGPVLASIWLLLLIEEWKTFRITLLEIWCPIAVGLITLLVWVAINCRNLDMKPNRAESGEASRSPSRGVNTNQ